MQPRYRIAIRAGAGVGLVLMTIAACVGEDAAPGSGDTADSGQAAADGTEGGRCFGNQSCLEGLICSASNLCVRLASGVEGGATTDSAGGPLDGGAGDADGEAAAPPFCERTDELDAGPLVCWSYDDGGGTIDCEPHLESCCPGNSIFTFTCVGGQQEDGGGHCRAADGGTDFASRPIGCTRASHCSSGSCCLGGSLASTALDTACPVEGFFDKTYCAPSCGAAPVLCGKHADCPVGTTCRQASLGYEGIGSSRFKDLGLCLPR